MKKLRGKKLVLFIAILCILLGSISLGTGVHMGMKYNQQFKWKWFHYDDEIITKAIADEAISFGDIASMNIEANGIDVTIEYGDENEILIQNIAKKNIHVDEHGDQLDVDVHRTRHKNGKMTIYLKKDVELHDFDLETNACNVSIFKLATNDLSIQGSASDIDLVDMSIQNQFALELSAGSFQGDIKDVKMISIESDISDIKLSLKDLQEAFNYDIENNLGRICYGNIELKGVGNQKDMHSNRQKVISIDANASDIDVLFSALAI